MIAVDTNLLVYAHRRGAPEHRRARAAIERAASDPRGWGISLPSVAEFWAIVTHPASVGGPSTPRQATRFFEALRQSANMQLWLPAESFGVRLMAAANDLNVSGARIFDLQIALVALEAGAEELWTHDSGFIRLPHLKIRDPLRQSSS